MVNFSDYVVYVDESGDHGLQSIDPNYPVFVLAFCIFEKRSYIEHLVPELQRFKFRHFGHDQVILHETDIRKDRHDFAFLKDKKQKQAFIDELTGLMQEAPFALISSVIRKADYCQRYPEPGNPYHVALTFGLERIYYYLRRHGQSDARTHIVVEKRGKREDDELELEFRRICDGANYRQRELPFELVFADKKSNSAGLQLADLVARPIGLHVLRPEKQNRAFEVLQEKFYQSGNGNREGWGLKIHP
ncbi:uncharacterized protein DUF3800 [Halospina denitrificans]|uniref:Uncharacterized protein DUF3800 n=1 Tax=Halospina denitrificans TaxID=332522 RepID=A0A4R7JIK6_9GAMM|nr:DUF3800 domain-containing protein [Halospina denitrificans]TDT37730.1 uncharacterized protein DUF3800 [Halospina denitrificans]